MTAQDLTNSVDQQPPVIDNSILEAKVESIALEEIETEIVPSSQSDLDRPEDSVLARLSSRKQESPKGHGNAVSLPIETISRM